MANSPQPTHDPGQRARTRRRRASDRQGHGRRAHRSLGARATRRPDKGISPTVKRSPTSRRPQRQYLSRDEFAQHHGAAAADIAKVAAFAKAHGLAVVESSAARRSVVLSGTAAALSEAFGDDAAAVRARRRHLPRPHRHRSASRPTSPASSKACSASTTGRRPTPHFQVLGADGSAIARARRQPRSRRRSSPTLYDFPTGADGSGQCIAIIELGGGFKPADLSAYFTGARAAGARRSRRSRRRRPQPSDQRQQRRRRGDARHRGRRRRSRPRRPSSSTSRRTPSQGFLDAITTAVHDNVNKPSVISISWGSAEIELDRAGDDAVRPGLPGRGRAGRHGLLRRGRQRLGRRRRRRQAARRLPGVEPVRARLRRHQARRHRARPSAARSSGTRTPRRSATGGGVSGFFALPAYQTNAKRARSSAGRQQGRPRRARRRRRRRPGQRLPGARRRPGRW